ncbi:probable metal-nicotianamine transporter YSL7 [Cajanus cajan]|nr:probable metal-nicotianamine transporter YSL7 [Cajanus cajan]
MASTYGRMAIITFSAWAGSSHGGVIAGLTACGMVMNIMFTGSDMIQEFKTGYMTLTSLKNMFISQVIGVIIGSILSPFTYWLLCRGIQDVGIPGSTYPTPYGLIYRNMAILGANGFSHFPKHCLTLCLVFFFGAMIMNFIQDSVDQKWAKFIPNPMAMSIGVLARAIGGAPDSVASNFVLDMCIGGLIIFIWQKIDGISADAFGSIVASALICGEGLSTISTSLLTFGRIKPPVCMKVLSKEEMKKLGI